MSENQDWSFDTQQIHSGQTPDPTTGSRSLPIYQLLLTNFATLPMLQIYLGWPKLEMFTPELIIQLKMQ